MVHSVSRSPPGLGRKFLNSGHECRKKVAVARIESAMRIARPVTEVFRFFVDLDKLFKTRTSTSARLPFCSFCQSNAISPDFGRVPLPGFIKTVIGQRDSLKPCRGMKPG